MPALWRLFCHKRDCLCRNPPQKVSEGGGGVAGLRRRRGIELRRHTSTRLVAVARVRCIWRLQEAETGCSASAAGCCHEGLQQASLSAGAWRDVSCRRSVVLQRRHRMWPRPRPSMLCSLVPKMTAVGRSPVCVSQQHWHIRTWPGCRGAGGPPWSGCALCSPTGAWGFAACAGKESLCPSRQTERGTSSCRSRGHTVCAQRPVTRPRSWLRVVTHLRLVLEHVRVLVTICIQLHNAKRK